MSTRCYDTDLNDAPPVLTGSRMASSVSDRGLQPDAIGCREPTGSFAQNRCQRFAEISSRDSFQVKGWATWT